MGARSRPRGDRAIRAAAGRKLRGELRAAIPTLPWSAPAAK